MSHYLSRHLPGLMTADLSRRHLLVGVAGVAAGTVLTGAPSVRAQSVAHRIKVGDAELTILSDGDMTLPPAFVLPGRPAAEIEAAFKAAGLAFSGFQAQVNVTVIRIGRETILIDTGGGPDFMATLGRLAERLELAGIAADGITRVVFTHAHPDHFWGVVDPLGGGTLFEKAEHVMAAAEFDFWMQADIETRVADGVRGMAVGTHRRLKPLAERIQRRKPGDDIVPGVSLVETGGHTPGHVSVLLRSAGQQALIGGDVLSQVVVSFACPDWHWGPDLEPERAAKSRRRILDQLVQERMHLLGYHLPWPGWGRVERHGDAYRFIAV